MGSADRPDANYRRRRRCGAISAAVNQPVASIRKYQLNTIFKFFCIGIAIGPSLWLRLEPILLWDAAEDEILR